MISTSTIGAIRREFAKREEFAFEVVYVVMPYIFLGKENENLRLFAAITVVEATNMINDKEEHYRIHSTFDERLSLLGNNSEDMTPPFLAHSQEVVCALARSSHRNDVPEKGDLSNCENGR
jgi:hypothetical protein